MARTGRPTNARARLDILTRLASGCSMAEIVRAGPWNRGQAHRYVAWLRREGLVRTDHYFSHLPTDGPGALRFAVTPAGALVLEGVGLTGPLYGKSTAPVHGKSAVSRRGARPAGVVHTGLTDPTRARLPAHLASAQSYLGAHNITFRFGLSEPPTRRFHWPTERLVSGVMMRWASLGSGRERIRLQLCGEVTLLAGFRVPADLSLPAEAQARDVRERMLRKAESVRLLMEKGLGCALGEPSLVSRPKDSITGDPVAKAMRALGITVHGEGTPGGLGVDDTPEEATLEATGAGAIEFLGRYAKAVEALGGGYDEVQAELAALRAANRTSLALLSEMARGDVARAAMQRELLLRVERMERRGPEAERIDVVRPGAWGSGRAA